MDDDPDILDALNMILESQGYQMATARDRIEALAKLKAERPDLMILDLWGSSVPGEAIRMKRKAKILLVDDDIDSVESTKTILESKPSHRLFYLYRYPIHSSGVAMLPNQPHSSQHYPCLHRHQYPVLSLPQ